MKAIWAMETSKASGTYHTAQRESPEGRLWEAVGN